MSCNQPLGCCVPRLCTFVLWRGVPEGAVSQYVIGYAPGTFYVEDFDGDGNPDIVFAARHPCHADLLPVTGAVTRNRELALCKTYDAIGYEIESQP